MLNIVNGVLLNFFKKFMDYLPNFLGGLLILCIGLVLSSISKSVLLSLFSFFRLASVLEKTKLMNKKEVRVWEEVLAEVLRWTIVILFLIPTLEAWGLSRATGVLNQFLFYLPNVIIAVIIGFVGLVAANMLADVVKHSVGSMSVASASTLSVLTKWAVIFFTILIVLNQLGVAQDLIRILFTGIVAMVALAGGLSFGLGGKDVARDILQGIKRKFEEKQ